MSADSRRIVHEVLLEYANGGDRSLADAARAELQHRHREDVEQLLGPFRQRWIVGIDPTFPDVAAVMADVATGRPVVVPDVTSDDVHDHDGIDRCRTHPDRTDCLRINPPDRGARE